MTLLSLVNDGMDLLQAISLREAITSHMANHAVVDKAHVRGRATHEQANLRAAKAKQSRGSLYNSHGVAAARSSHHAYLKGESAEHSVAAQHHEHAAEAAVQAKLQHEPNSIPHEDYKTAEEYHKAQAHAHRMAAKHADRGNLEKYRGMTDEY